MAAGDRMLGFAGVGVGAAMVGLRPVVEFMTWNFALLALDQVVNAAAKMLYMSGGQFPMPIVFRGPNGAALQLSAQHSQAWESWLAHIPGLKVVAPGTPYDAKGLLKSAIRDDNPVIVLEGEMLYNTKGEVPDEEYLIPLGKADLKREGSDCSIITSGKMVLVAMQAADTLARVVPMPIVEKLHAAIATVNSDAEFKARQMGAGKKDPLHGAPFATRDPARETAGGGGPGPGLTHAGDFGLERRGRSIPRR